MEDEKILKELKESLKDSEKRLAKIIEIQNKHIQLELLDTTDIITLKYAYIKEIENTRETIELLEKK